MGWWEFSARLLRYRCWRCSTPGKISRLAAPIQHYAVLIDSAPEILWLAIDFHEYLIQMPLISWPRPASPQLVGKGLAKLLAPLPDRFIGDEHAADHHHFLDVAITEAEAEIEPHTVTDDFSGKTMATIQDSGRVHGNWMHHKHARPSIHC